jgi:hypothetical protein|tara:strand:- start:3425 stop:3661 length:237 start_codon:yes stop_codon:yes gene_type:complete
MLVLPYDNWVIIEIAYVGSTFDFGVVVQHHPANVREQETSHHGVWIFHGVGPAVVGAVIGGPPSYATLDCSGAGKCKK